MALTLEDIKAMEKDFLSVNEVAQVLKVSPKSLRRVVHMDATDPRGGNRANRRTMIGFPYVVIDNRYKFPRIPFIMFVEGKKV